MTTKEQILKVFDLFDSMNNNFDRACNSNHAIVRRESAKMALSQNKRMKILLVDLKKIVGNGCSLPTCLSQAKVAHLKKVEKNLLTL